MTQDNGFDAPGPAPNPLDSASMASTAGAALAQILAMASDLDNLPPAAGTTVAKVLAVESGPQAASNDIATAWDLVKDIGAADMDAANELSLARMLVTMALATGCLCRALTPPAEGGPGPDEPGLPRQSP